MKRYEVMRASLLAMVTFALVGAVTPGPVNLLAIRHGSSRRGLIPLMFVVGASGSYAIVVAMMGAGAQQLLLGTPILVTGVQWMGAAYLLYLSWSIAVSPLSPTVLPGGDDKARCWRVMGEGFTVQALNPKAWMVALAGVGLFVLPHSNAPSRLWEFTGMSFLACFIGVGAWAALGRVMSGWLEGPRRRKRFNRMLAIALALTVVTMLF